MVLTLQSNSAMDPSLRKPTVVISGMSGTYAKSEHNKDFSDILYNKVDVISSSKPRWDFDHPEVPKHHGKVPNLQLFDATFFKVSNHLARCMDPMSRKILEHTHRAIYDAGLSADYFVGRNVGVFIGSSVSETEKVSIYNPNVSSYSMPGCSKTMFANRISYWLDVKGPSMTIDDGCCSSLVALELAFEAIQRGDCEAAIVGGAFVALHAQTVLQFARVLPFCKDGKIKSFHQAADGSAMSDAVSVVFLQKAEDALRMYAEIVHIESMFDIDIEKKLSQKIGFRRNSDNLTKFLQGFYKKAGVVPSEVEYVEAFGSGIPEVDKTELETIEKVFCNNRNDPLLVGSVISNVGFTEAASGLTSLTKVLLGYQTGLLAANLNCANPRRDVSAIQDGRMRIVTEHEPFHRSYAAINDFSITGVNGHILLRGCYKPKVATIKPSLPYLVNISGRKESSVQKIIDDLKSRPVNNQELALLHNIHEEKNVGNLGRGYIILDSNDEHKALSLSENVDYYDDVKRPLWFVYSGMGSQWAGMGAQLMKIPIFAAAIQRCDKVLAPKEIDIIHIITSSDRTIFDNILNSFVGIAAIQIGLTDVLYAMGIYPDNIIGHSVGELGCAYADGCFTAEEMILSAYSRGLVSVQTKFIHGSMAAVGIGYQQAKELCPPEIEIACHNGPDSCTISGPADIMRDFVGALTAKGIFAKEVPCSNIAYHSRYIAEAGPKLLEYLSEVIKSPKRRSERWVSTSVPQERWSEKNAQYCSAWYHTNNLLSPVLFEETSRLVEPGAVLVEVAPHGLLQAILKRSMHPDCRHIPLTKRGHPDNTLYLLEAFGKLFLQGYNPKVKNLYPRVEFPVPTETPFLSHLLEWNYSDKWTLMLCKPIVKEPTRICNFLISIHDMEHEYLRGNVIKGRMLYPYSAVLVAVWDTLAMSKGVPRKELSVQFSDVHLFTQPILHEKRYLKIKVSIHQGTGEFEVSDNFSKVAEGIITDIDESVAEQSWPPRDATAVMSLDSNVIYNLLQERDYSYSGEFKSLYKSNSSFTEGELICNNNWVTLIDGMLQLNILQHDHSSVSNPSHIHKLTISPREHNTGNTLQTINDFTVIFITVSPILDCTRCGGILMEKIRFEDLPPVKTNDLRIETLQFSSRVQSNNDNIKYIPRDECQIPMIDKECDLGETTLHSKSIGDLNSLHWVKSSGHGTSSSRSDILVKVRYAAVNVLDANVATKVISPKRQNKGGHRYGMDYSGITATGARVMGLVRGGAAGSRVRAVPGLTWPAPAHWTLEDAATVPLAYACAFYCLGIKFPLHSGMTILVQGGSGALGQAIISIALALKCKVFTTVKDVSKKEFLLRLYPDLKEEHIGCSRDESFADLVLIATKGNGCDICICCSTENLKNATLKCCSFNGIIIDTIQAHIKDSYYYGMYYLTNQRSYAIVDFYNIFENTEHIKMIQSMISEGIARGYVKPLSRVTYAAVEATRAFRLLAASQHRGRVLLRLQDSIAPAQTRLTFSSDLHQLVVCNEDNISFTLVNRLITCGARKIILHSCTPSPFFYFKQATWKKCGVTIQTIPANLNTVKDFNKLFKANKVEGIFIICSGKELDKTNMASLDMASRNSSHKVKYFSIISPTQTLFGEQLCVAREKMQLPGSIIYLLPSNKDETTHSCKVSQNSLMDIIELALQSSRRLLKIVHQPHHKQCLLENIESIAGIKIPVHVGENLTLRDLGFDSSYSKIVRASLRDSFNVSIENEQIQHLTVALLKQIEANISEPNFKESDGLGIFFSYVDRNELLAITEIITLPTLFKSLKVRDDMVDLNEQYLWVVPGLEGNYERFRPFCERLKVPALVLQPGLDRPQETPRETAQNYVKILSANTGLKKNDTFYIVGYENGIFTALEMAAILEECGMKGTVFCIGGTPELISWTLKEKLNEFATEEALQDAVLSHMIKLICNRDLDDIVIRPNNNETWHEKVDRAIRLSATAPYSSLYMRAAINAAYTRTELSRRQSVRINKLKSEVVVLRTTTTYNETDRVEESICDKPLKVYDLKVPLECAIQHPLCASIVNSRLSPELIERYENRNHCEALTDPEMFVSKFAAVQEDKE